MKPQARITIPYAVANFVDLRERGFYYVDKTMHIPDLELYNAPVFLRPRRFGKSLLISMLASYYDLNQADRFEELFGGLYIGSHPTAEHNRYMVIRFDFSKIVMADTIEGLKQNFNDLNCDVIAGTVEAKMRYAHLFPNFEFRDRSNAIKMLEDVLRYILTHNLPPVCSEHILRFTQTNGLFNTNKTSVSSLLVACWMYVKKLLDIP